MIAACWLGLRRSAPIRTRGRRTSPTSISRRKSLVHLDRERAQEARALLKEGRARANSQLIRERLTSLVVVTRLPP